MRDLRWDNIRCLLMFLVVFGHMLELCQGQLAHVAYQLVYAFHMPAFLFVTGYFAKFKPRSVVVLAGCYFIFQTLYGLFSWGVLGGAQGPLTLQYAEPYWLMWYLMATVFYYLLVPVLARVRGGARWGVLGACVLIALACGYLPVSRFLTLARFLAFLPYFVAGYYAHEYVRGSSAEEDAGHDLFALARKPGVVAASCVAAFGGFALLQIFGVSNEILYCASSYAMSWSNPLIRFVQLVTASGWIMLLLALAPNNSIPLVTRAGQNTMPIFLLHGFVVRALGMAAFVQLTGLAGIGISVLVACVLVVALGQPALNALLRFKLPRKPDPTVNR